MLQNIQVANDRILQFTDKLNLPNIYKGESGILHTSSDGQKFEVAVDSLNVNYSFKYKGVSVMTFIDMRDLMWHSTVISSAEREAAYVIDGLMHNDVDISVNKLAKMRSRFEFYVCFILVNDEVIVGQDNLVDLK